MEGYSKYFENDDRICLIVNTEFIEKLIHNPIIISVKF